jgi:hypothetical protein
MKPILILLLTTVLAVAADKALKKVEFRDQCPAYLTGYSWKVEGIGGHAKSTNFPKPAPATLLTKKEILLAVDLRPRPFDGGYEGLTLRLVNGTSREAMFEACDSRFSIVQEAQDKDGHWREIECLQSSWCGNSCHRLFLPPKECWEFVAPRYSGPMKTKLRFKLVQDQKRPVYSDTFGGSIHPGQFIEKRNQPTGGIWSPNLH